MFFVEKYFDMNKKQCRDALDLYKKFLIRMDRVAEFLKVAEVCLHGTKIYVRHFAVELLKAVNITNYRKTLFIPLCTVLLLLSIRYLSNNFITTLNQSKDQ
jgi:hypothetical protein